MYLKAIKKSNRKKSMWLFLLQYFFPPSRVSRYAAQFQSTLKVLQAVAGASSLHTEEVAP